MGRLSQRVAGVLTAAIAGPTIALTAAPPVHASTTPAADSASAAQPDGLWPLARLKPKQVWPLTRGAGITVAVIDSGVVPNPQLRDAVLPGKDFASGAGRGTGTVDTAGHGTRAAGIIAARPDPEKPFSGIAPSVKILPVRVLPSDELRYSDAGPAIARAIRWAVDQKAQVINLSLTTDPHRQVRDAVEHALERDVVVVAAVGNTGEARPGAFPGALPGVLTVAAVEPDGRHASSSIVADYVDVAAPGAGITAPDQRGAMGKPVAGTSYAAPYVSATAALVRAYYPQMPARQVVERIMRTADHPAQGHNPQVGYGVVNPYQAVAAVFGEKAPQAPPTALPAAAVAEDPLAGTRTASLLVAAAALVGVGVGGAARMVIVRGRARAWRPGRDAGQ